MYYEFLLEFFFVRHFGSERPSLFGLSNFGGIQPSPYSITCNNSLEFGKSEHYQIANIHYVGSIYSFVLCISNCYLSTINLVICLHNLLVCKFSVHQLQNLTNYLSSPSCTVRPPIQAMLFTLPLIFLHTLYLLVSSLHSPFDSSVSQPSYDYSQHLPLPSIV